MREIHAKSVRITEDDELEVVITHMLQLVALQNCVANCSQHALGCMVRAVHDKHMDDEGNEEKRIGAMLDQLQRDRNDMQYILYGESLSKCGCDKCTACVQFDNEFYDQLEENGKVSDAQPPSFEDRPLHCMDNKMRALNVKSRFAGLSSSSLENAYYFAQSTTTMSPPTISTATPTAVMYHVITRHVGLESLRAVRQMVFEAKEIYLECDEENIDGKPCVRYNRYQRALAHIWLKNEMGDLENLAIKLASAGYTMSFYVTGMNTKIDATMQAAMSLCYKAPSTIAGAGFGLFLQPHDTIPQGTHLCLYASRQATAKELQASSRDYALMAANGCWFDVEVENGNKLG
ncbi:Hypothetical predicted protein [Paramuricea clavata]|uniref:Uncharacterized protein n=1 Tax=Paramuricea clavata TaxID=317549 RepID=A0A6S7FX19_PARCT|nr:Hypothetical predicted protein [Paramuricea clavata]